MLKQLKKCKNNFHQFNLIDQANLRKIIAKIESVESISTENIGATVAEMKFFENSNKQLETEILNSYNNEEILKMGCKILDTKPQILKIQNLKDLWKQIGISKNVDIRKGTNLEWPKFGIGKEGKTPKQRVIKQGLIEKCLNNYLEMFHFPKNQNFDLVQIALLLHHYFELIHPFQDGNGRLGRILISLFLIKNKIWINNLFFPISYSIKKNKENYLNEITFFHENNSNQNVINFENAHSEKKKINYLVFLDKNKINYQNYLQTMEMFFNKTIEKTEKLFTIYSKFKLAIKKQLQVMKESKKFRIFKKKENLIKQITDFLTSDAVIMLDDFKKTIDINYRTINKIMEMLCYKNLFSSKKGTFPYKKTKKKTMYKTMIFYINQKIQQNFKETAFSKI